MKQLFLVLLLLVMSSCVKSDLDNVASIQDEQVTLEFRVDIPSIQSEATKAINENRIYDLQLLVFDENDRFVSRHKATVSGPGYTVTLPQSGYKRTIHFIGNYNWSEFDDAASIAKDEGEIVAPLQSTDLIFWQRIVLESGISKNVFTQPIFLLRNMAKFTLTNHPDSGLASVRFALFNIASAGSIAPFNTENSTFESVITEPVGVDFTNSTPLGAGSIYVFERKNSTVIHEPTYVIVRGLYYDISYYYKIDIVDEEKNLYDIKRNVLFDIIIQSVTKPGYSTIEEAQSSPASNNISASILLQSYPTISDGTHVLSVDKTIASFTSDKQMLNANAIYKTIDGAIKNNSIEVTLKQDINLPVVDGDVLYDPITGNITAKIHDVPANGVAHTAVINVVAGNLSRTIRLKLHSPFEFENINMTPSVVDNVQNFPTSLEFSIPNEAEYMLPFNVYITSKYLTPEFGNVEVVYEDGQYKYKWKVTSIGVQTINFLTNTEQASEMIFIESRLFERGQTAYLNRGGINSFSNVKISPNPIDFGVAKPLTLRFTVPTAGIYEIHTSNLDPLIGSVVGGVYTYNAAVAGEQVIDFVTNKQNSNEIIELKATSYNPHIVRLKNQLVNISGKLSYNNWYRAIRSGVITTSVGAEVVGIYTTNNKGDYSASLEVNMGDELMFSYTRNYRTYVGSRTVTSPDMVINKTLK